MNKTMTPVASGRRGPNRGPARAGAIGFLGLARFQAALALGAPLGTAAWISRTVLARRDVTS